MDLAGRAARGGTGLQTRAGAVTLPRLPLSKFRMASVSSEPAFGPPAHEREFIEPGIARLALARDGAAGLARHIAGHEPALIEDFAAGWPALETWNPPDLSRRFGDRSVRVYDASFGQPGPGYMGSVDTMPFARFLDDVLHHGRDLRMFLYNIARQIPELVDDIAPPPVGVSFSRRFIFTFFGCRGATTPLHYDIDMGCVFHTVIRGRRRIRLFSPDQSIALYRHPFTVRSYIDLDRPNDHAHPALRFSNGREFVMEAGQTLFMPPGWWHEFHYLEPGIGVSLRSPPSTLGQRAQGVANLLLLSPLDRLANRIAGEHWYRWKQRKAAQRAHKRFNRQEVS